MHRTIGLIREAGCKPGLVFNPATPLTWLDHCLEDLDLVLIMSVNPGFGGQSFIPSSLDKLRAVRQLVDDSGFDVRLEVDGGVKPGVARQVVDAGADVIVAGSAVFNHDSYTAAIEALRKDAE